MQSVPLWILVALGGLFYVGGQYVASQPLRIEQEIEANREITVQGTGEVTARPDVAKISLGVQTGTLASAEAANERLAELFNAVLEAVKAQGIAEEDIKATNLSVNPVYDYTDGRRILRGYEANETVEVKVRELDKAGSILSSATREGVNQAGNVQFEIDDPDQLQLQAQEEAIKKARENAEQLAKTLDVKLGRVKSFSLQEGSEPPILFQDKMMAAPEGRGGDAVEIPSGTQDVTASVSVTYELK